MAKYALMKAPYSKQDGRGMVIHEIWGVTDEEKPIRGMKESIDIKYTRLAEVLAMPHDTGPERQAKNLAYRNLIKGGLPQTGWSGPELDAKQESDIGAAIVAGNAVQYITEVLKLSFPFSFPAAPENDPDGGD